MARENGGGGAFAWTLLGFLAGVAATLGLQLLLNGPTRTSHEEATSSAVPHVAVAASSAPEVKKPVAVVSSAAPTTKRAQPAAEVADDAAAAGMTSRTDRPPADPDPDVPPDHSATPSN
jgi:hypothetical protein